MLVSLMCRIIHDFVMLDMKGIFSVNFISGSNTKSSQLIRYVIVRLHLGQSSQFDPTNLFSLNYLRE